MNDNLKEIKNFLSSDCKETYLLTDYTFESALEEFGIISRKDLSFAKTFIESFDFIGAKEKLIKNFELEGELTQTEKDNVKKFKEELKKRIKENPLDRTKFPLFNKDSLNNLLNHYSSVQQELEEVEFQKNEYLILFANIVKFESQIEILAKQIPQIQEKTFKEVINELAKNGELIHFIEDNINLGFDFFDKSKLFGFEKYNETNLTDLDGTFIGFMTIFSKPDNDVSISINYTATTIDNYTYLQTKLERELEYKFNEFKDEKSQENYARLLKIKFERFINALENLGSYSDLILSKELKKYIDNNKSDFLNSTSTKSELNQTEFEQVRQMIYIVFSGIVSVYLTAIRNITNSYFPSFNLKMDKNVEYIEENEVDYFKNTNKFKWNSHKTDLAELVFALSKTQKIVSTETNKPATKKELLEYFSQLFGQDINDESLLSNAKQKFKRSEDNKTFTRKLADIFDEYLKKDKV